MAITKLAESAQSPPAQPSPFSVSFKSYEKVSPGAMIILVGRQGHGKTTAALTLSEKFDVNGPPGQVVDDIMVITNEKGALDCARHCVSEFKYWVDLTDFCDRGMAEYEKIETAVMKEARALVADGKIKGVVYDNASTRDKLLSAYKAKEKEGWPLINWLMLKHREFVMEQLLPLQVPVAVTCHTQPVKTATPLERETLGIDSDDREVINMTGNHSASIYRAHSSIIPCWRTPKGEFLFDIKGKNGQEAKMRFKAITEDFMEPNLRKLLAKTVSK